MTAQVVSLHLTPITFADACTVVGMWHRHNKPPVGHKFSVGVQDDDGVLHGAVIVGRPVARHLDDGLTLEAIRTATDGTPNANSMLYGAAARATFALGYERLITYTQADESGSSLRGAGWRVLAERPKRKGWSTPTRPRDESDYVSTARTLWEVTP